MLFIQKIIVHLILKLLYICRLLQQRRKIDRVLKTIRYLLEILPLLTLVSNTLLVNDKR